MKLGFSRTDFDFLIFDYRLDNGKLIAINFVHWLIKFYLWTSRMKVQLPSLTGCKAYIKYNYLALEELSKDENTFVFINRFSTANV